MRNMLIFFVGVGVGGLAVYALMKDKIRAAVKEEHDAAEEFYKKSNVDSKPEKNDISDKKPINIKIAEDTKKNKVNYSEIFRKSASCNALDHIEATDPADTQSPSDEPSIYPITPEEFNFGNGYFDKITLTYYMVDGVLANQEDDVVDINETIGPNGLAEIGRHEPDVAYIRNEKLGVDYEVVREDLSYAQYVKGDK